MTSHHPPERMFTQHQLYTRINDERRRARHVVRFIWVIAMLLTVPLAASVRMQQFIELSWYWPAIIGVSVNGACWYLASKIWFQKVR